MTTQTAGKTAAELLAGYDVKEGENLAGGPKMVAGQYRWKITGCKIRISTNKAARTDGNRLFIPSFEVIKSSPVEAGVIPTPAGAVSSFVINLDKISGVAIDFVRACTGIDLNTVDAGTRVKYLAQICDANPLGKLGVEVDVTLSSAMSKSNFPYLKSTFSPVQGKTLEDLSN